MDYETAFERTVGIEGKYVDHPEDPGGETNWGITWPVLREAIALGLVPATTTIKGLTRDDAKVIYHELFWRAGRMEEYDQAIAYQVFDFAVNSSIHTALRKLQRAVGVADDGHIGAVTVAAIKGRTVTDVIMLFLAERLDFWTSLSTWATFGRGWARRAATDLRFAAEDS